MREGSDLKSGSCNYMGVSHSQQLTLVLLWFQQTAVNWPKLRFGCSRS